MQQGRYTLGILIATVHHGRTQKSTKMEMRLKSGLNETNYPYRMTRSYRLHRCLPMKTRFGVKKWNRFGPKRFRRFAIFYKHLSNIKEWWRFQLDAPKRGRKGVPKSRTTARPPREVPSPANIKKKTSSSKTAHEHGKRLLFRDTDNNMLFFFSSYISGQNFCRLLYFVLPSSFRLPLACGPTRFIHCRPWHCNPFHLFQTLCRLVTDISTTGTITGTP